jgi:hypothetical protein
MTVLFTSKSITDIYRFERRYGCFNWISTEFYKSASGHRQTFRIKVPAFGNPDDQLFKVLRGKCDIRDELAGEKEPDIYAYKHVERVALYSRTTPISVGLENELANLN